MLAEKRGGEALMTARGRSEKVGREGVRRRPLGSGRRDTREPHLFPSKGTLAETWQCSARKHHSTRRSVFPFFRRRWESRAEVGQSPPVRCSIRERTKFRLHCKKRDPLPLFIHSLVGN